MTTGTYAPIPSDLKRSEANERYACARAAYIQIGIRFVNTSRRIHANVWCLFFDYIYYIDIRPPARTGILAAWDCPNFRAVAQEGVGVHRQQRFLQHSLPSPPALRA